MPRKSNTATTQDEQLQAQRQTQADELIERRDQVTTGPMPPKEEIDDGRVLGADEKPRPSAAERANMSPRDKARADPTRDISEKEVEPATAYSRVGTRAGALGVIRHPEQNPPLNDPDSRHYDPLEDDEKGAAGQSTGLTGFQRDVLGADTPSDAAKKVESGEGPTSGE